MDAVELPEERRRLAAIMYTDIVGYTPLGQRNESLSLALVKEHRNLVRPILARHNGREVKTMGDAFLVEFASALEGVRCAYDIQRANRELNLSLAEDKRINLRIGIHLGEVVEDEGDILGDAVNVASRIEKLAEDGGVCLTSQIHDQVQEKIDLRFVSMGQQALKGVSKGVQVYRVAMPWEGQRMETGGGLDSKRVAVLPFSNMSPDPNDEYFADGMTEELIDRLAHVNGIEVIARTSVMSYKKKEKKVTEIANELFVGSVIEGSVRKAGNRIRVTAQLIDAASEGHLWSEHYDRSLDDIFAVQSEIAEKVAGELKVQLLQPERETIEKKPTENMEAYGDFLRGRELHREGTTDGVRQALKLFERAVELDPSFARAHVGVAECHLWLGGYGYESFDVMHPAMRASLKRALELDPNLAEAHAAFAQLLAEDDIPGAEAEGRRALELNPNLPEPYFVLSLVAGVKGDPREMVRLGEVAYRLEPATPFYIRELSFRYFFLGMEQELLNHVRKTEHLDPTASWVMARYSLSKGDLEGAKKYLGKYERESAGSHWGTVMEGLIAAYAGDREVALRDVKKNKEAMAGHSHFWNGFTYYALGDMDSFFEHMNWALEAKQLQIVDLMYSPSFAKARTDPRYQDLVERFMKQSGLARQDQDRGSG